MSLYFMKVKVEDGDVYTCEQDQDERARQNWSNSFLASGTSTSSFILHSFYILMTVTSIVPLKRNNSCSKIKFLNAHFLCARQCIKCLEYILIFKFLWQIINSFKQTRPGSGASYARGKQEPNEEYKISALMELKVK